MLASTSRTLFNGSMETQNPLNAQTGNRGLRAGRKAPSLLGSLPIPSAGRSKAESDWQAAGIVDQMLAYRDWWNLPARKPAQDRGAAKHDKA